MSDTVLVACLSCAGTLLGTIGGILAAQKLTNFRLQELEKRVEKHNQVVERTFELEARAKGNTRRIEVLETKTDHIMENMIHDGGKAND